MKLEEEFTRPENPWQILLVDWNKESWPHLKMEKANKKKILSKFLCMCLWLNEIFKIEWNIDKNKAD